MEDISLSIVNRFGTALTEGLGRIQSLANSYAGVLTSSAQLICGILAFLYIGSKLWKSWAKGEPIDFYAMLRPFAVGLLIVFFNGFTYCLDALVSPVEAATVYVHDNACERISDSRSEYSRLQKQLSDNKAEYERSLQTEKEKLSVWRTIQRSLLEIEEHISSFTENAGAVVLDFVVDLGTILIEIFSAATVGFTKFM